MISSAMLLPRSVGALWKGGVQGRIAIASTQSVIRHYVGLAPQTPANDNVRFNMADTVDTGARNTINNVTTCKCLRVCWGNMTTFSNLIS